VRNTLRERIPRGFGVPAYRHFRVISIRPEVAFDVYLKEEHLDQLFSDSGLESSHTSPIVFGKAGAAKANRVRAVGAEKFIVDKMCIIVIRCGVRRPLLYL
jgi:hypothetical protein